MLRASDNIAALSEGGRRLTLRTATRPDVYTAETACNSLIYLPPKPVT